MALKAWNGTRHVRSRGYEGKSVARITYVLASRILTLKVKEVGNADEQTTNRKITEYFTGRHAIRVSKMHLLSILKLDYTRFDYLQGDCFSSCANSFFFFENSSFFK